MLVAFVGVEGLLSGLGSGGVTPETLPVWMVLGMLRWPLLSIGVVSRDTDVGAEVMLASVGAMWVLSLLKYFIVVVVVSISTFCLFLNTNGGFLTTVLDSSATMSTLLALGRMLWDEPITDSAAVAMVSLSVEEQFRHIAGDSVAKT